jgi:hypothetical protein
MGNRLLNCNEETREYVRKYYPALYPQLEDYFNGTTNNLIYFSVIPEVAKKGMVVPYYDEEARTLRIVEIKFSKLKISIPGIPLDDYKVVYSFLPPNTLQDDSLDRHFISIERGEDYLEVYLAQTPKIMGES